MREWKFALSIQFHLDGSELTVEDGPPRGPYVDFLIY